MTQYLIDILIGTTASLIAALVLYRGFFEPLRKRVYEQIERLINPVEEFRDMEELCRLLKHGIDSYDGDYRRLILLRALPCELSDGLLMHIYDGELGTQPSVKKSVQKYQELVSRIIKEGVGCYDESIFGRTDEHVIDSNTAKALKQQYFLGATAPDTTALGFHSNLNEAGIILLGETEDERNANVIQWNYGYLLVFSGDFRKVRGFMYRVNTHIENLRLLYEQKKQDSQQEEMYQEMSSRMTPAELSTFEEKMESFYG